jgi:predicted AAA+ superfamily ATPase
MPGLAAVAIEGAKGVGKTATAQRRADVVYALDDEPQRQLLAADPGRIDRGRGTVLIDEWQRHPAVWDEVRRSVDRGSQAGRFLLTGSAIPTTAPMHSGAGRIVQVRMRPMSLTERGVCEPTVSLQALLSGRREPLDGESPVDLPGYVEELVSSGFPGIRPLPDRARRAQLDGYLTRIVERDFPEQGHSVRRPATLRAWLTAYAAATATCTSYTTILDAATSDETDKPAKATTIAYRDVLSQLFLLDSIPGWLPVDNAFARLAQAPKHYLVDPALSARLLDLTADSLLSGKTPGVRVSFSTNLLGQLFEALVALCLQVYAQADEARVQHMRTRNGDHEIDFIITGPGGRVVAVETKLAPTVDEQDITHLRWLKEKVGDLLADAVVVTTGRHAYRRPDGVAVVPAALLGP